jgi:hypothetical protein
MHMRATTIAALAVVAVLGFASSFAIARAGHEGGGANAARTTVAGFPVHMAAGTLPVPGDVPDLVVPKPRPVHKAPPRHAAPSPSPAAAPPAQTAPPQAQPAQTQRTQPVQAQATPRKTAAPQDETVIIGGD